MAGVHLIATNEDDAPVPVAPKPVAPESNRGAVKSGDQEATQWRQDMQVAWLRAAVMAQQRRVEPVMDPKTLEMPCPRT